MLKPLVFRDGTSTGHVVGNPAALQSAVDETPAGIDVDIERIGRYPAQGEEGLLSHRQREAVETAFEMGYYERPRETTHAEIGAELDCAPNTVTVHLQTAEAKLVERFLERS